MANKAVMINKDHNEIVIQMIAAQRIYGDEKPNKRRLRGCRAVYVICWMLHNGYSRSEIYGILGVRSPQEYMMGSLRRKQYLDNKLRHYVKTTQQEIQDSIQKRRIRKSLHISKQRKKLDRERLSSRC
jgi:hypothetical protein